MFSYSLVGLAATFLDFIVFLSLAPFVSPFIANVVSFCFGFTLSYSLNMRFAFKSSHSRLSLLSYLLINLTGLCLGQFILFISLSSVIIPAHFSSSSVTMSKILSISIVAIFQFLLNSRFSMRSR